MKTSIGVRFQKREFIDNFLKNDLNGRIPYKYNFHAETIETPNVKIKCVVIGFAESQIKVVRGLRFDGCINFDDEATLYLCRFDNKCQGYRLLDYILEKNGVDKNENN